MVSRHQERYIDGTPWSLQTSFYPMSLVERGAHAAHPGQQHSRARWSTSSDSLGIKQAGYRDM